jgi:hypothetical protein
VLGVAALLYAWSMGHAAIHPYYSAAIRSMATSWRAFFFGGLDTSGSITLDKVPGAFWPDAVSVWIFASPTPTRAPPPPGQPDAAEHAQTRALASIALEASALFAFPVETRDTRANTEASPRRCRPTPPPRSEPSSTNSGRGRVRKR